MNVELAFPYMDVKIDINCNCVAGIFNTHLLAHLSRYFCILKIFQKKSKNFLHIFLKIQKFLFIIFFKAGCSLCTNEHDSQKMGKSQSCS